jgi:hypothetical protein
MSRRDELRQGAGSVALAEGLRRAVRWRDELSELSSGARSSEFGVQVKLTRDLGQGLSDFLWAVSRGQRNADRLEAALCWLEVGMAGRKTRAHPWRLSDEKRWEVERRIGAGETQEDVAVASAATCGP